jgi:serine/threonine protein phosphatase PrpC
MYFCLRKVSRSNQGIVNTDHQSQNSMSEFSVYIKTNQGGREENQDCYGSKQLGSGQLIVVCDGMGGAAGGKLAAEMACQHVLSRFSKSDSPDPETIRQAIESANTAVFNKSRSNPELQNMGTTIAVLYLEKGTAGFFHLGDTRIYQIRNGRIENKTSDHSRVGEMVRRGILSDEQARLSTESNIISRALGIAPDVEIEMTTGIKYERSDRFALCTDGIWGTMPEEKLIDKLSSSSTPEELVNGLITNINKEQQAAGGGHDNMTLAFVLVNGSGPAIKAPVLANIVLALALASSLIYIFSIRPHDDLVTDATADSTAVNDSGLRKPGVKDSVRAGTTANSPAVYQVEISRLNRIRELIKKLRAETAKDSASTRALINKLSKEIEGIR